MRLSICPGGSVYTNGISKYLFFYLDLYIEKKQKRNCEVIDEGKCFLRRTILIEYRVNRFHFIVSYILMLKLERLENFQEKPLVKKFLIEKCRNKLKDSAKVRKHFFAYLYLIAFLHGYTRIEALYNPYIKQFHVHTHIEQASVYNNVTISHR